MNWEKYIVQALENIGGEGSNKDIYNAIEEIRGKDNLSQSYQATVRDAIHRFSKDSTKYGGKENLFYSINGIGKGIWGLNNYSPKITNVNLTEDDIEFPEGKEILKLHILRERSPKLIRLAKEKFKKENGKLFCEICDFDFEKEYGQIGKDYIEAHHSKAISDLKPNEKTKIEDIVMVCSNCHKMLHRKRPWLNKSELKKLKNTMHNNQYKQ